MTNLTIAYLNRGDSATLLASPAEASTAPIAYLQNDSRGYQFQASAAGTQVLFGDWAGTAYTVGCVRLDRTSLADGDTWRIQLFSDTAWTTSVYDSGTITPFATDLYDAWNFSVAEKFFTAVASVKSFKITIVSAAVFQASRLFIGPYTIAAYNPKFGASLGWSSNSKQSRRDGGSLSVYQRAQWRSLAFEMFAATEAERAIWMEIGRYCSNNKTVWVSVFPSLGTTQERDFSVMGKFEESPATKCSNLNVYDFSIKLNEI